MKEPNKYFKYMNSEDDIIELYSESKDDFIRAIKQAQKDSWNEAVKECYKNSEVRIEYDSVRKGEPNGFSDDKIWIRDNDGSGCNLYVDKNSILKLLKE